MLSKLGAVAEQVGDALKASKALREARLTDIKKPRRLVETFKNTKIIGPMATVMAYNSKDIPDRPAISDEHGTLTWAQVDRQSNALANTLLDAGLKPGSVVGIIARDHRAVPLAQFAAGRSGIRLALMNTGFGAAQFVEVAEREKLEAILYDEEFAGLADSLPPEMLRIVTWHEGDADFGENIRTLEEVVATGRTTMPPTPKTWGGMVILTSGTTGLPKGARRAKFSPFASALLVDRVQFPYRSSVVIVSPLFHSTGFATWAVATAGGNETVLLRRFDAEKTLAAIERHKAELLVAVPTMLHRILALGPEVIGKYDTSSLKSVVVAGSALSPTLSEAFQDQFGNVLYNLYGSTEVAIASIAKPEELRQAPGTIGKAPVSSYMVLFDDNDQRITEPNVKGRLFVRNGAPFEGYTDGRNKQILEGHMSTGDMAYFDENGLWFIAGRDDDMIVSGGENVYPLEVENLLAEHDAVADIAVIGVDDDEFGTRLRAFVVPAEGASPDADELRAHVKSNLARYKVPRDIVFVEDLPRNPTGKLVRRELPTGPLDG
ncbi:putative acid--CoA ligase [Gordonia hirsuta DSM 44140 = NBRC 16056]|uniref:Putative acid--CoA ligase n=1 Tax=Gordonia hirsuta DSM 44140 = NBRC 16056 TaxID=1121927 RepID=L7L6C7_9ACTN|nr:acyl-CoA synthetase [Gordonia hirsuta]GAC56464.1 putative acid--CoA ligase [Gordonia hirsuta DSM 44140 = NBRC 16056]